MATYTDNKLNELLCATKTLESAIHWVLPHIKCHAPEIARVWYHTYTTSTVAHRHLLLKWIDNLLTVSTQLYGKAVNNAFALRVKHAIRIAVGTMDPELNRTARTILEKWRSRRVFDEDALEEMELFTLSRRFSIQHHLPSRLKRKIPAHSQTPPIPISAVDHVLHGMPKTTDSTETEEVRSIAKELDTVLMQLSLRKNDIDELANGLDAFIQATTASTCPATRNLMTAQEATTEGQIEWHAIDPSLYNLNAANARRKCEEYRRIAEDAVAKLSSAKSLLQRYVNFKSLSTASTNKRRRLKQQITQLQALNARVELVKKYDGR